MGRAGYFKAGIEIDLSFVAALRMQASLSPHPSLTGTAGVPISRPEVNFRSTLDSQVQLRMPKSFVRHLIVAGLFAALGGAARAQIIEFRASITGAQEVPAVATPAIGSAAM